MRRIIATLVAFALAATPQVALAEHIDGDKGWYVEYNTSGRMDDNYTKTNWWADNVGNLQPGDDITLTVEMRHKNGTAGDWYLSNEVLKSLEEGDAKGSAYGYKLSYEGPSNSRTLYESKTVGGMDSKGLLEATNAMDDYFFLGTLSKGDEGKVVLNVSLDGETEGNAYFDTLAQLKLKFAVEQNPTASTERQNSQNRQNNQNQRQDTNRTNRSTEKTPQNEETVNQQTTEDTRRTDDTKKNSVERSVETTSENTYNNVEGATPENVNNIVYEYVDGATPSTTIVNRVISGSTSGLARTGDETTLFPVYAAMVGAGLVVLAIAIRIVRKNNTDEKGDVQ